MKFCLALVACLIQGSVAAAEEYEYSAVAQVSPTGKEAQYSLTLDPSRIQLLMPLSGEKDNTITALEFEICRDTGLAHRLGSGGYGGVFAGRLSTTNAEPVRVAIKIGAKLQFSAEAKCMERLNNPVNNPAINNCYAHGSCASPARDEDSCPRMVVVMELVNGRSLLSYIVEGKLPENTRISIIHQVANALEYMHSKACVHGDIAPRNIMVTRDGDRYNVVLIDFGRTVSFEDHASNGAQSSFVPQYNDLMQLAMLCEGCGLKEHAKVFPLDIDTLLKITLVPGASDYVHSLERRPELFAKHLVRSEGHPATEFLPGLLGYAEFKALPRDVYERVLSLRAQIRGLETPPKKLSKGFQGTARKTREILKRELEALTKIHVSVGHQKCD